MFGLGLLCLLGAGAAPSRVRSLLISAQQPAPHARRLQTALDPHTPNSRPIRLIEPAYGSIQGTTSVTIRANFSDADSGAQAQCRFGDVTVVGVLVRSDAIRCIAPQRDTIGQVVVAATVGSLRYRTPTESFIYYDPYALPEVASVEPRSGGLDAAVAVTVRGANFAPTGGHLVCEFGSIRALVQGAFVDAQTVICVAPISARAQSVAVRVACDGSSFSETSALFTLHDPTQPPTIASLSPQAAALDAASTRVTVVGANFRPDGGLLCRFGRAPPTAGLFVTSSEVVCDAAAVGAAVRPSARLSEADTVDVALSDDGGLSWSAPAPYVYYDAAALPDVHAVRPAFADNGGSAEVVVSGLHFAPTGAELQCAFRPAEGGEPGAEVRTAARFISTVAVGCVVPQTELEAAMLVFLTLDGSRLSARGAQLVVYDAELPPSVRRAEPAFAELAPTNGQPRQTITITGANLAPVGGGLDCRFGAAGDVVARFVDPHTIECEPPAVSSAQTVELTLAADGHHFSHHGVPFTFYDAQRGARLDALEPAAGELHGRSRVTVLGANFYPAARLRCEVRVAPPPGEPLPADDEPESVAAVFVDSGRLICVLPPSPFAAATEAIVSVVEDAVLALGGGGGSSSARAHSVAAHTGLTFTYYDARFPATLASVSPPAGAADAPTTLTLLGSGFQPTSEKLVCEIGGARTVAKFISPTRAQCDAPPAPPGDVDVAISTDGGETLARLRGAFTRFSPSLVPTIVSVTPRFASVSERAPVVTVAALNVAPTAALACDWGAAGRRAAAYGGGGVVRCEVPAAEVGAELALRLTTDGVHFSDPFDRAVSIFDSSAPPSASKVSPSAVPLGVSAEVRVSGSNLAPTGSVQCELAPALESADGFVHVARSHGGDVARLLVRGTIVDSTTVACALPPFARPQLLELSVSLDGKAHGGAARGARLAVYDPAQPPGVIAVSPDYGDVSEPPTVTLRGFNFSPAGASLCCQFGERLSAPARYVSATEVTCVAPRAAAAATAPVRLSTKGCAPVDAAALAAAFMYFDQRSAPTVVDVEPTVVGLEAQETLRVRVRNAAPTPGLACTFDSLGASPATYVSAGLVECAAPRAFVSRTVVVAVTRGGGTSLPEMALEAEAEDAAARALHRTLTLVDLASAAVATECAPRSAAVGRSATVQVLGSNFARGAAPGQLLCRFGEVGTVVGTFVRTAVVRCDAPIARTPTTVPVSISLDGGSTFGPTRASFTWWAEGAPPRCDAVTPRAVHLGGGELVRVRGAGFAAVGDALQCVVGASAVPASLTHDGDVECVTPAARAAGTVSVYVSVRGVACDESAAARLTYYDVLSPPSVESIAPGFVEVGVGGDLLVRGRNFAPTARLACSLGAEIGTVPATFVSPSALRCVAPPWAQEAVVPVRVTHDGSAWSRDAAELAYYLPPTLGSLSPIGGDIERETLVAVRGAHFFKELDSVAGGLSHHENLFCALGPPLAPPALRGGGGAAEMRPAADAPPAADALLIVPAELISGSQLRCRIPPLDTPSTRPFFISTTGRGADAHWVGGASAGAAGARSGGLVFSAYDPRAPARVDGLAPRAAPIGGGEELAIVGSNFRPAAESGYELACRFGFDAPVRAGEDGTAAAAAPLAPLGEPRLVAASHVSTHELRCVAPISPGGARATVRVQVSLSGAGGPWLPAGELTYYDPTEPPHVWSASPAFVPRGGHASAVTVRGANFAPTARLVCVFEPADEAATAGSGARPRARTVAAEFISPTQLRCAPERARGADAAAATGEADVAAEELRVFASLDGRVLSAESAPLVLYEPPRISSIEPRAGSRAGGTRVTVRGGGFFRLHEMAGLGGGLGGDGANLMVGFGRPGEGGVAVAASLLDEGDLVAISPPEPRQPGDAWGERADGGGGASSVSLYVSVTGGFSFAHDAADAVRFTYYDPARRAVGSAVLPAYGPIGTGETRVRSVALRGANFAPTGALACVVDGARARATFVSGGEVLCEMPARMSGGTVAVALSLDGLDGGGPAASFTYYDPSALPAADEAAPTWAADWSGGAGGGAGTLVTIRGSQFVPAEVGLRCLFRSARADPFAASGGDARAGGGRRATVNATFLNFGHVACVAPAWPEPEDVRVCVSVDGGLTYSRRCAPFAYFAAPRLDSLELEAAPGVAGCERGAQCDVLATGANFPPGARLLLRFGDTPRGAALLPHGAQPAPRPAPLGGADGAADADAADADADADADVVLVAEVLAVQVSTTQLRARVPAYARVATLAVALGIEAADERGGAPSGGERLVSPDRARVRFSRFDASRPPAVTAVEPDVVAVAGARAAGAPPQTVAVRGDNFPPVATEGELVCVFGGDADGARVVARFESASLVHCEAPELLAPGSVDVRVVVAAGAAGAPAAARRESAAGGATLHLHDPRRPLLVASLEPSFAPLSGGGGGGGLTVRGSNFAPRPLPLPPSGRVEPLAADAAATRRQRRRLASSGRGRARGGSPPTAVALSEKALGDTAASRAPPPHPSQGSARMASLEPAAARGSAAVAADASELLRCVWCDGAAVTAATFVSSSEARCAPPSGARALSCNVSLVLVGGAFSAAESAGATFTWYDPTASAEVERLWPRAAPLETAQELAVYGHNFAPTDGAACRFGAGASALVVRARVESSWLMHCTAPRARAAHSVPFAVTLDGARWSDELRPGLTYFDPTHLSDVARVEPSFGPLRAPDGGARVTVHGRNFADLGAGLLLCHFGELPTSPALFVDEASVLCTPPASPRAEGVDVHVSIDGFHFGESAANFVFYEPNQPPSVHAVWALDEDAPAYVDVTDAAARAGAQTVRVRVQGANFAPTAALACKFGERGERGGGALARATFVDARTVECDAPRLVEPGAVRVAASTDGRAFSAATPSALIRFYDSRLPPLVRALEPLDGEMREGARLLLRADNLAPTAGLGCALRALPGEAPFVPAWVAGALRADDTLECVLPPVADEATVRVHATTSSAAVPSDSFALFTFYERDHLADATAVEPAASPLQGGGLVTIVGRDFAPEGAKLRCLFGEPPAPGAPPPPANASTVAEFVHVHAVVCRVPPARAGARALRVHVTNDGLHYGASSAWLGYYDPTRRPDALSVSPSLADVRGGTRVTVIGTNLAPTGPGLLRCRFLSRDGSVSSVVAAEWHALAQGDADAGSDASAVVCATPRVGLPGDAARMSDADGSASGGGRGQGACFVQLTIDNTFAPLPRTAPLLGAEPDAAARDAADGGGGGRLGGGALAFGFFDGAVPPIVSRLEPPSGRCGLGGSWVENLAAPPPRGAPAVECSSRGGAGCVQVSSRSFVSVRGANFAPAAALQCSWGDGLSVRVRASWRSATEVRCPIPVETRADEGMHKTRRVVVDVSNDGYTWHTSRAVFTYDGGCVPHSHTAWTLLGLLLALLVCAGCVGLAWQRVDILAARSDGYQKATAELERRFAAARAASYEFASSLRGAAAGPVGAGAVPRREGVLRVTLKRGTLLRTAAGGSETVYALRVRAGNTTLASAARRGEGSCGFESEELNFRGSLDDFIRQPLALALVDAAAAAEQSPSESGGGASAPAAGAELGVGLVEIDEMLGEDADAVEAVCARLRQASGLTAGAPFTEAERAELLAASAEHSLKASLAPSGTVFLNLRWCDARALPDEQALPAQAETAQVEAARAEAERAAVERAAAERAAAERAAAERAAAERAAAERAAAEREARLEQHGRLIVHVLRGSNLPAGDSNGLSDPYVIIALSGQQAHRTRAIARTLDPVWDEQSDAHAFAPARLRELLSYPLRLKVWDKDVGIAGLSDDPLGDVAINLADADKLGLSDSPPPFVVALPTRGSLTVSVRFEPGGAGAEAGRTAGRLEVLVVGGSGLPMGDANKSDYFVRVSAASEADGHRERKQTSIVTTTGTSPVWDQALDFTGDFAQLCEGGLEVDLVDADTLRDQALGSATIELRDSGVLLADSTPLELDVALRPQGWLKLVLRWQPAGAAGRQALVAAAATAAAVQPPPPPQQQQQSLPNSLAPSAVPSRAVSRTQSFARQARPAVDRAAVGELSVWVRYAHDLIGAKRDLKCDGTSDPYAELRVNGATSASATRTITIKKTLNPEWNQTLKVTGRLVDFVAREMEVEIFSSSSSLLRKPTPLGKVRVDLRPLLQSAELDLGEVAIPPPHRGVLALTVSFQAQQPPQQREPNGAGGASARSSRAAPPTITMM